MVTGDHPTKTQPLSMHVAHATLVDFGKWPPWFTPSWIKPKTEQKQTNYSKQTVSAVNILEELQCSPSRLYNFTL